MTKELLENVGSLLRSRLTKVKPSRCDETGWWSRACPCAKSAPGTTDRCLTSRSTIYAAPWTKLLFNCCGISGSIGLERTCAKIWLADCDNVTAETFYAQLSFRRQRAETTLSDLLHDVRHFVVLACPVTTNETIEYIARDAFV